VRELTNGGNGNTKRTPKNSLKAASNPNNIEKEGTNDTFKEDPSFSLINPNGTQNHTYEDILKRYTLKFSIDSPQTRVLFLDALQMLIDFLPDRCELLHQNHTIFFRADSSLSKPFVKTFLQIVGKVCGFDCSFGSPLNSATLSHDQLSTLRSVLVTLGIKWKLTPLLSLL